MATVITNLLSAIPFIGNDVVPFIWGGFKNEGPYYSDIILKILLDAGTFSIIILNINIINGFMYRYIIYIYVKIIMTWEQSAVILKNITQRLNVRNLYVLNNKISTINNLSAYFVGLIEGNGWFKISKNNENLIYELGIEMNIRDVQLMYKLKKVIGVGIIKFRKDKITGKDISVIYLIRNKKDLINIILPIFDKYSMLSNKQYDYLRFRNHLLLNRVKNSDLDINNIRPLNNDIDNIKIINCKYFSAWLVGFIEAKGCFSIYKSISRKEKIVSFEISQNNNSDLIKIIQNYLNIKGNIYNNNDNFRIKTTSIRGIENVIKFLVSNNTKLLGYKRLEFLLFLKELRSLNRFKNINIPNNY